MGERGSVGVNTLDGVSIDLHTHSTASDGTDAPADVIVLARQAGVDTIALTDHDTTAGWAAATARLPAGLTFVPGAEISCVYDDHRSAPVALHLLAYLFDPDHSELAARLDVVCADRLARAERMVDLMAADGMPVTWAAVTALAEGGTVGRPHLARALVQAGVVASVDAAFAGPISSRSRYYIAKADIPVLTAIALVGAAGGISVFAHPLRRGRQVSDDGIAAMAAAGLRGIEVDHPDHGAAARAHLAGVAGDLGLITTGSSDYHGTNKRTPIAACVTDRGQFEALVEPARGRLVVG